MKDNKITTDYHKQFLMVVNVTEEDNEEKYLTKWFED